jgi:hypothetical protein
VGMGAAAMHCLCSGAGSRDVAEWGGRPAEGEGAAAMALLRHVEQGRGRGEGTWDSVSSTWSKGVGGDEGTWDGVRGGRVGGCPLGQNWW